MIPKVAVNSSSTIFYFLSEYLARKVMISVMNSRHVQHCYPRGEAGTRCPEVLVEGVFSDAHLHHATAHLITPATTLHE